MSEMQRRLINEANRALRTAGVRFAIELPDGRVVGELPVVVKKPKQKYSWNSGHRWTRELGLTERLSAMQPGDAQIIDAPAGCDRRQIESLRGSICAIGGRLFGLGEVVTTIDGTSVLVARKAANTNLFDEVA